MTCVQFHIFCIQLEQANDLKQAKPDRVVGTRTVFWLEFIITFRQLHRNCVCNTNHYWNGLQVYFDAAEPWLILPIICVIWWLLSLPQTRTLMTSREEQHHDDAIKWKHFPRYWAFVRGIHRWPVNSPHKGQWRGALMFSLICAWINGWVNNREAGDLRRHRAHHGVTVMCW